MTTSDILKRYLEYNHLKVTSGNAESFEPLLPFVLMDTVYQLWCKRVQPMNCRFQQNHYKKEWKRQYSAFNSAFFRAFNPEQTSYIVDLMDEFDEYNRNDRTILKVQLMNCCDFLTFEEQDFLSDLYLCDIFTKAAQSVWTRVYKHPNPQLELISRNIVLFMGTCYHSDRNLTVNDSNQVSVSLQVMFNKMVKWLYEKSRKQVRN